MGDILIKLGGFLTTLGLIFMPFSFLAYVFLKFYEFGTRPSVRYTKLVKIIWIALQFIIEFSNDRRNIIMIVLLIALEIVDTFFEFLEEFADAIEIENHNEPEV